MPINTDGIVWDKPAQGSITWDKPDSSGVKWNAAPSTTTVKWDDTTAGDDMQAPGPLWGEDTRKISELSQPEKMARLAGRAAGESWRGIRQIVGKEASDAELERKRTKALERAAGPVSTIASELVGGLADPVTLPLLAGKVPVTLGKMALQGAKFGAASGFLSEKEKEESRLSKTVTSAGIGAVAFPAVATAGRAIAKAIRGGEKAAEKPVTDIAATEVDKITPTPKEPDKTHLDLMDELHGKATPRAEKSEQLTMEEFEAAGREGAVPEMLPDDVIAHLNDEGPKGIKAWFRNLFDTEAPKNIEAFWDRQGALAVNDRKAASLAKSVDDLVPRGQQELLRDALQNPKAFEGKLSENHQKAIRIIRDAYQIIGEEAQQAGLLDSLKNHYLTQIWDFSDARTKKFFETVRQLNPLSGFSPYAMESVIKSYKEGIEKYGLKPKFENVSDMLRVYTRSMGKAVENKKLIETLKGYKAKDGTPLIVSGARKVPYGYISLADHPEIGKSAYYELQNYAVHPDVFPSLKLWLDSYEPQGLVSSLRTLNFAIKRNNVGASLFHSTSLMMAYIGTGGKFSTVAKLLVNVVNPKFWRDLDKMPTNARNALETVIMKYYEGGNGDMIELALRHGLVVTTPIEDQLGRTEFRSVVHSLQDVMDKISPIVGKPVGVYAKIEDKLHNLTWNYLHIGMKLETFSRLMESKMTKRSADLEAGKSVQSIEDMARDVAAFTNSSFGGINWERSADAVKNKVMRGFAQQMSGGRRRLMLQLIFFAPDWKISTAQSWYKALPELKGKAINNTELNKLHQTYLLRSTLITMVLGNAINYKFSGHFMWQNDSHKKKPDVMDKMHATTLVDLGDGRTINPNKHYAEGLHWMTAPGQQMLNSLGYLPKEVLTQLLNKKYITSGWAPPISDPGEIGLGKRAAHAAGAMMPITIQQLLQSGPSAALSGFAGFPTQGMTAEQKAEAKQARRESKRKAAEE